MDSNVKSGTGESVYRRLYGEQAMYFEGDLAPKIKHSKTGHLSMVNVGDNMFGSQFFITLDNDLDYLDGQGHCVFGEVVEGLEEIVQTFNETICDSENIPYQDIRITHTVIVEDPFEDPKVKKKYSGYIKDFPAFWVALVRCLTSAEFAFLFMVSNPYVL